MLRWVILWSLWASRLVRQPTEPVRVSNGLVRGSVSHDGAYRHYLSIPYATVTDEHRFKAAGPEPKWKGVFEAVNENVVCPHTSGTTVVGDDDCLVLNVYTPLDTPKEAKLPVMVFIHGGGFYEGAGRRTIYGPTFIVKKGVILVTFNYRINILGFLCLGIKEAPGNAGMKDQVQALKWVQKNIKAFGGDPDNVTIFGESAGGASVSLQVLSPMSKGLFHKAIMQSGSSLSPWAYQFRPTYMASLLAKTMGYQTEDPYELYDIFMNKSIHDLIYTRVPRKKGNTVISELLYVPCTEEVIDGVEPFLTESPYDVYEKGNFSKIPIMIGSNDAEGLLFCGMENDTSISEFSIYGTLPKNLIFPSEEVKKEIERKIDAEVMGGDAISKETMGKFGRIEGEPNFNYPVTVETDFFAKANDMPVYSYLFKYDGRRNIGKLISGPLYWYMPGAVHADDLFYLFDQPTWALPLMFENKMIDRMTTLWTNFAKYGNPTPTLTPLLPVKWDPVDPASPKSFIIDEQMGFTPLWTSAMKFWHDIYSKYRRKY